MELVKNKDLQNLFCEYSEVAIDAAIGGEALDAIPIVGTLTKGGRAILSIRDRLFINKLGVFLRRIDDVEPEERKRFVDELENTKRGERLAEELLSLVDRIENKEKAKIVGELFKDHVRGKIEYSNFNLLCVVVDRTYIMDLHMLRHVYNKLDEVQAHLGLVFGPYRVLEADLRIVKYSPDNLFWTGPKEDQIKQVLKLSPWGQQLVNVLVRLYGQE